MKSQLEMEVIGNTIDDAAGEAFDKCGKVMGFTYPAGPLIDKLAVEGNMNAFRFSKPHIKGLDFSFSGLKTSFLYFLRDRLKEDPDFIENNKADLCALSSAYNCKYSYRESSKCISANRNKGDWYRRWRFSKFRLKE